MIAAAVAGHLRGPSVLVAATGAGRDLLDLLMEGRAVDKAVRYLLIARIAGAARARIDFERAGLDPVPTTWELVTDDDTPRLIASVTLAWAQVQKLGLLHDG